jgi:hypothetical protein
VIYYHHFYRNRYLIEPSYLRARPFHKSTDVRCYLLIPETTLTLFAVVNLGMESVLCCCCTQILTAAKTW